MSTTLVLSIVIICQSNKLSKAKKHQAQFIWRCLSSIHHIIYICHTCKDCSFVICYCAQLLHYQLYNINTDYIDSCSFFSCPLLLIGNSVRAFHLLQSKRKTNQCENIHAQHIITCVLIFIVYINQSIYLHIYESCFRNMYILPSSYMNMCSSFW